MLDHVSYQTSPAGVVQLPDHPGIHRHDELVSLGGKSPRAALALFIQLLGGFQVSAGGQRIADAEWRLRKARSLVKLLALAPRHRLHREECMERLWPSQDPEAAANNLHKALHV